MINEHLNAIKSEKEELAVIMKKSLICFIFCLLTITDIYFDFPNILEWESRFP